MVFALMLRFMNILKFLSILTSLQFTCWTSTYIHVFKLIEFIRCMFISVNSVTLIKLSITSKKLIGPPKTWWWKYLFRIQIIMGDLPKVNLKFQITLKCFTLLQTIRFVIALLHSSYSSLFLWFLLQIEWQIMYRKCSWHRKSSGILVIQSPPSIQEKLS